MEFEPVFLFLGLVVLLIVLSVLGVLYGVTVRNDLAAAGSG